jgi:hypothetical protein
MPLLVLPMQVGEQQELCFQGELYTAMITPRSCNQHARGGRFAEHSRSCLCHDCAMAADVACVLCSVTG